MKILVGCDPEVFVKKNGVFQSAYGLIKGDKKNPHKVRNGAVQVDGMALEFNIDPANNEDEFCINVQDVLHQMTLMVPDYQVVATPVAKFDIEYMKTQPKEALELGCDPDYNAWTGLVNVKPDGDRPMRTASGHVHIGWTNDMDIQDPVHRANAFAVNKQMDFFLGLSSLLWDEDQERRSMYGKSGCTRIKPYGTEYRTLSNAWLKSESLIRHVYRNTIEGVNRLMAGDVLADKYPQVQAIINDGDAKAAIKILNKENIKVCYG